MAIRPFDVPPLESESNRNPIRKNIETVVKMEERSLEKRSGSERLADGIGAFCGSMSFIVIHFVIFTLWIVSNLGMIPGIPQFDRYPFMLLSLAVSLEAIFLSTFVLMKQNRMSRRADARSHLDLQINLLTEKEITLVLQMLHQIGTRLGLEKEFSHDEFHELSTETAVEDLASELQEKIPD